MAYFPYLATWNDFWQLVKNIDEKEAFTYIPALQYSVPVPSKLSTVTTISYRKLLWQEFGAAHIYMWSPQFSWDDIVMTNGGPRGYEVSELQPILSWNAPGDFVESNEHDARRTFEFASEAEWPKGSVRKLNCGMLSYPDEYQDSAGRWHKRSPELKAAYQRVCSHMKEVMVRYKFKSYIWIGREAHQLVKEGKVQVIAHV